MSIGSLEGRILLAAVPVAALLAWDIVLPWAREMVRRGLGETAGDAGAAVEDVAAPVETSAVETSADNVVARREPDGQAKPPAEEKPAAGTTAEKSWQAARELPHQFIPDWKHDEDYLNLLHEAAVGGSEEAMGKLSDYAFRRRAFVEAYYWKLKLGMSGGRLHDIGAKDILSAWVACGCPTQYRNVMRGFSEEQGMFARAVMRLKAGIDVGKASRRLKQLAKAGNADARQYLRSGKKQKADLRDLS